MFWRLLIAFAAFAVVAAFAADLMLSLLGTNIASEISVPILLSIAAIVPAWLLARRFVRPFQELTDAAYRIAEGEYSHRIPGGVWGESRSLARTFNTMSKRLEAQFQQLEADRQQLRTILGGMVEGVVALGPEQRVLFANEAAGQMLQFDPQAAVGRPIWEVTRLPQIQEVLTKALRDVVARREEFEWKGPTARQLAIYVAPLLGEHAPGAVLVLHDITELRRLERLRQDFVANVSHELKTPLSVIKACIEALLDGAVEEPEVRRPFLDQISDQGERLHSLILDLISLARIESGEEAMVFPGGQPRPGGRRLSRQASTPRGSQEYSPGGGPARWRCAQIGCLGRRGSARADSGQSGRQRGQIHSGRRVDSGLLGRAWAVGEFAGRGQRRRHSRTGFTADF